MTGACDKYRAAIRDVIEAAVPSVTDELALHLDACPHCRRLFDLGKVDLSKEGFEVLDEAARQRVVVALGSARVLPAGRRRRAAGLGAVAAAALIAAGLAYFTSGRPTADRVADTLVEDHIRYLGHPDRHGGGGRETLKLYLESYVEFPVEIALPPQARLTGGRRCFVLGRRVALMFYETVEGPVSYFVFAADGLRPLGGRCPGAGELGCSASRGYRLASWESAGLLHVLVGSRERPLVELAKACRSSPAS